MAKKTFETVVAIVGQPNNRGELFTEEALRELSQDNNNFIFNEQTGELICSFEMEVSGDELSEMSNIFNRKKNRF